MTVRTRERIYNNRNQVEGFGYGIEADNYEEALAAARRMYSEDLAEYTAECLENWGEEEEEEDWDWTW